MTDKREGITRIVNSQVSFGSRFDGGREGQNIHIDRRQSHGKRSTGFQILYPNLPGREDQLPINRYSVFDREYSVSTENTKLKLLGESAEAPCQLLRSPSTVVRYWEGSAEETGSLLRPSQDKQGRTLPASQSGG
jgi:hypothetical protein